MNRKTLLKSVAEEIKGSPVGSQLPVDTAVRRVLSDEIIKIFVDCEVSVSTAKDVLGQVERKITVETVVNREAKEKAYFS